MAERVSRYRDKVPLFEAFGVDAEIRSTLSRRVDLPSGGYLIFDYAEAFTVIDVNTGRFVGSRSKTSGARLEDTVTKNNLEAVKEVVRQLRLRDIGGIIVIDFIDMANPKNREAVEQALQQELERDRTKTYVVEISPLGLVEMTRQNVTDGPREILTRKCPTCAGEGVVVSEATAVVDAERRLRALAASKPRTKAFKVELNAHVAELLIGPGATRLEQIEAATRRRFFLVGKAGVPHDHFAVLDEGTIEKLAADGCAGHGGADDRAEARRGRPPRRRRRPSASSTACRSRSAAPRSSSARRCPSGSSACSTGPRTRRLPAARPRRLEAPITAEAQAEKPTRASRAKKPELEAPEAAEEPEPGRRGRRRGRDSRGGGGREERGGGGGAHRRHAAEEADPPRLARRPRPAEAGRRTGRRRGCRDRCSAREAGRGGGRGAGARAGARGRAALRRRRGGPSEEEDPARLARRARPQEEAGRRDDGRSTRTARPNRLPPRSPPDDPRPRRRPRAEAPAAENGDEPAAPRKKTRRGSRGGRRRRKPAGAAAEAAPETRLRRGLAPPRATRRAARPSRSCPRAPTRRGARGSARGSSRPPRRPAARGRRRRRRRRTSAVATPSSSAIRSYSRRSGFIIRSSAEKRTASKSGAKALVGPERRQLAARVPDHPEPEAALAQLGERRDGVRARDEQRAQVLGRSASAASRPGGRRRRGRRRSRRSTSSIGPVYRATSCACQAARNSSGSAPSARGGLGEEARVVVRRRIVDQRSEEIEDDGAARHLARMHCSGAHPPRRFL